MKWRPIIAGGLACAAVAGVALWVVHANPVGHWLEVHTGTVNEPGPYYGFWSVRTWAEHDAVVDAAWMARGVNDVNDVLTVAG